MAPPGVAGPGETRTGRFADWRAPGTCSGFAGACPVLVKSRAALPLSHSVRPSLGGPRPGLRESGHAPAKPEHVPFGSPLLLPNCVSALTRYTGAQEDDP